MRTRLSVEILATMRERFGPLVYRATIRETVRLREAYSFQKPITAYDPKGPGAEDYRAVAERVASRIVSANKSASIDSGRMPVLFTPSGSILLLLPLLMALNGQHVQRGTSFWRSRRHGCHHDQEPQGRAADGSALLF